MQEATLLAETGREIGSAPTRRLRTAGQVPGVMYGKGGDAVSISVSAAGLRAILIESGGNAVVRLQVEGKEHLTLVKQLQRHPVRNTIDHVDFQLISASDTVHVEVPIHLIGEAELVSRGGGSVEQAIFHVHVHCSPVSIPQYLEADITDMEIGISLLAEALVVPEGVELDIELTQTIASAHLTRAALSDDETEGEEGEEGEGEGDSDAAEDSAE